MYYEQGLRKNLWQGTFASIGLLVLTVVIWYLPKKPNAPYWVVQYWQIKLPLMAISGIAGLALFPWKLWWLRRKTKAKQP